MSESGGDTVRILEVNRFMTVCCGYLFNYAPYSSREQPTLCDMHGADGHLGTVLGGECPGCRAWMPDVERVLGSDGDD